MRSAVGRASRNDGNGPSHSATAIGARRPKRTHDCSQGNAGAGGDADERWHGDHHLGSGPTTDGAQTLDAARLRRMSAAAEVRAQAGPTANQRARASSSASSERVSSVRASPCVTTEPRPVERRPAIGECPGADPALREGRRRRRAQVLAHVHECLQVDGFVPEPVVRSVAAVAVPPLDIEARGIVRRATIRNRPLASSCSRSRSSRMGSRTSSRRRCRRARPRRRSLPAGTRARWAGRGRGRTRTGPGAARPRTQAPTGARRTLRSIRSRSLPGPRR